MKQLKKHYKLSSKNSVPFGALPPRNSVPFGAKIVYLLGQNSVPFGARLICKILNFKYLQPVKFLIIILIKDLNIFNYIETAAKNFWIFGSVSPAMREAGVLKISNNSIYKYN